MPLPSDFNTATVFGKYVDLRGDPVQGTVTFKASTRLLSAATQTAILPAVITVKLSNGEFTVDLPATDDPDITPTGWSYQVTESFGGYRRSYSMLAPLGVPIDLTIVAPTVPVEPVATQVLTIDGQTPNASGDIVPSQHVATDRLLDGLAVPMPIVGITKQPSSTIVGAVLVPPDDGRIQYRGAGNFTFGIDPGYTDRYLPTSQYPHTYGGNPFEWSMRFGFDGAEFELLFRDEHSSAMYRLQVDDLRVTHLAQFTPADSPGYSHVMKVTFPDARPRVITVEFRTVPFGGVYHAPTAYLWRPQSFATRAIFLGDSITGGSGQNTGGTLGTWMQAGSDLLRWDDPWSASIGGTGYTEAGSQVPFGARYTSDVSTYNPDVVVIAGGYNDFAHPTTTIALDAAALYQKANTETPNAAKYVVGPWLPYENAGTTMTNMDNALHDEAALAGLPYISQIFGTVYDSAGTLIASQGEWITGNGDTSAPAGNGNADRYVGADGVHPTDEGHAYLARRFVQAVESINP